MSDGKIRETGAYLLVIPIEQCQEAGLSASCALDTSESDIIASTGEIPKIPKELLRHAVQVRLFGLASEIVQPTWIQRVARLPTVVSCAGWKWVKPSVGRSLYCSAKVDSLEIRIARERMR